jgi:hypothetical protein
LGPSATMPGSSIVQPPADPSLALLLALMSSNPNPPPVPTPELRSSAGQLVPASTPVRRNIAAMNSSLLPPASNSYIRGVRDTLLGRERDVAPADPLLAATHGAGQSRDVSFPSEPHATPRVAEPPPGVVSAPPILQTGRELFREPSSGVGSGLRAARNLRPTSSDIVIETLPPIRPHRPSVPSSRYPSSDYVLGHPSTPQLGISPVR